MHEQPCCFQTWVTDQFPSYNCRVAVAGRCEPLLLETYELGLLHGIPPQYGPFSRETKYLSRPSIPLQNYHVSSCTLFLGHWNRRVYLPIVCFMQNRAAARGTAPKTINPHQRLARALQTGSRAIEAKTEDATPNV